MTIELAIARDNAARALTAASRAVKEANAVERAAQAVYDAACIEFGKVQPLRFNAGDKVKRSEVRRASPDYGFYRTPRPDKSVVVRGVVTLCEQRTNYRNHYPRPGEWFVLSASGQTAYSLNEGWELDA